MKKTITVQILGDDVFCGWQDVDGIDQQASADAYAARFADELRKAFPGVETSVDYQPRTSGYSADFLYGFEWDEETTAKDTISAIGDMLLNDSESWLVMVKD